MTNTNLSRRQLLLAAAVAPLAGALVPFAGAAQNAPGSPGSPPNTPAGSPAPRPAPKRTGSFAHMTDCHIQPERDGFAGLAACLAHVQSQSTKPEFIMTGGDNVMDVFEAKQARMKQLSDGFRSTWKSDCSLPVEHCIGNHDIYGWNKKNSETTGTESNWGKKFAIDLFGVPQTYRSFDRLGWRFIVLDSVQPKDSGYVAYCDDAQWDWLRTTLKNTPKTTPICVVSHIPILSLTPITYGKARGIEERGKDTLIGASAQHTDCQLLHEAFKSHGGVKLCLSGHQHLLDKCETDGITYICDGAVSGAWWKGPHQGVAEGYGLIDLYDDGSFKHQYVPYGWKARS